MKLILLCLLFWFCMTGVLILFFRGATRADRIKKGKHCGKDACDYCDDF